MNRRVAWILGLVLSLSATGVPPVQAENLQCRHLPQLFELYLRAHYSVKSLSEDVQNRTIEQFIESLDPSKTLFLEEEVVRLKKTLPVVFKTMKLGSCDPLEEAYRLVIARAKEDEAFAKKFLDDKYKLDETVELVLDPEKRGYPKTAEERTEMLKKMVHFQISNYLLTDMKLPEARKQLIHKYELVVKRLVEKKDSDLTVGFAESFARALDPHSSFLSAESLEDFQIQMRLSLEGIGASLSSQDGFTVIEETIPGGAADRAKILQPKDKIIAVAQDGGKPVSVMDMDLRDVVKLIRGKKGTKVKLTVLRDGKTFEAEIVRDKIDIKEQAAKITYETREVNGKKLKIGVIDLPSFYGGGERGAGRSSYEDTRKLLIEAKKNKVDGVVLNLSRNGGGLLEDAVRISGLFIRLGGVVATKNTEGKVEVLSDKDPDIVYEGPLVVLISRFSASASEILAGALKDYKRAVVVGEDHTFGKGTVQVLNPLPLDLGAMKVTTGMFFLPAGNSTQHTGVNSDITIPSIFNTDEVGEKRLHYSLPMQTTGAFVSPEANVEDPAKRWEPVQESVITKLAERSKARVAKDKKFAELTKELEEAKKNKGLVKLAELRQKAEKENAKDKKKNGRKTRTERVKEANEREAPVVQEAVNIAADLIAA